MLTYQQFMDSLEHTTHTDDDYYSLIVYFKDDILMDIAKLNQGIIAKRLGMNSTKLSFILFILKLDITLTNEREQTLTTTYTTYAN